MSTPTAIATIAIHARDCAPASAEQWAASGKLFPQEDTGLAATRSERGAKKRAEGKKRLPRENTHRDFTCQVCADVVRTGELVVDVPLS